jgi:Flp pilus assembly protein TadD
LQKKLKKQADAIISAAASAYGQGRYAETEALCRQIVQAVPDHFDATHLLGLSVQQGGRLEEAEQLLERAIAIDPRSHEAHNNLAAVHLALRKFEAARAGLEKAIALKPNFPPALAGLGSTFGPVRPGQAEFRARFVVSAAPRRSARRQRRGQHRAQALR